MSRARSHRRTKAPEPPRIPGYRVWRGRVKWHARSLGSLAETERLGRPWHVTAETFDELRSKVQQPR